MSPVMCSGGPWGLVADSLVAVDAAVPAPGGDRHHGRGDKRGEVAEPGTRVTELVVTATESRPLSWTVTLPRSPAWDSVPSVSGEAGASGTGVPSLTSGTMVALPGPWAAPVGLKCPPADSNGVSPSTSQTPVSWICSPCSPGGRFETVMVRLRAPSDSEPITVPIWSPSVLRTPTAEIDDRDVAGVASWAVAKPMLARARTPAQVAMRGVRQEENPPELVRAAVICPPESREHAIRVPLVLRFWPARYWHPPDRVEKPGQNIDARRCLARTVRMERTRREVPSYPWRPGCLPVSIWKRNHFVNVWSPGRSTTWSRRARRLFRMPGGSIWRNSAWCWPDRQLGRRSRVTSGR